MQDVHSYFAKSPGKSVCIIGGGIAGLSASVFLANEGLNVTLVEASPKLGGRAYSFFDKNLDDWIDNGQHILASWYTNTFDFLKIIGTYDRVKFQQQLEVVFADLNGNRYRFKCPKLPPPFHLMWGLWTYKPLGFRDKIGIFRLLNSVVLEKYSEEELKSMDVAGLFVLTKQSENVINYFWKPFIIAVFNAEPEETSAWQFMKIIKTGFLRRGSSNLVLPKYNLNELYVNEAEKFLYEKKAKILKSARVENIDVKNELIDQICLGGVNLKFDYYICAVPFFEFRNLFSGEELNGDLEKLRNLTPSPILNIHFEFEGGKEIMTEDFIGILNATIQWVFRVNEKRICIVISSAKNLVDKDKDELIELCKEELLKSMPGFINAALTYAKVIKEKRATFLPDNSAVNSRPGIKTKIKNLFIAGDWIDTGYPATIESAVTSSRNCVNEILNLI